MQEATRFEMMLITGARELAGCRRAFIGFHWPVIASRVARRIYQPSMLCAYEGGFIEDTVIETIPTSNNDLILAKNATMCGDSLDTLYMLQRAGWLDATILDGLIVDRFGNVNTTCLGEYRRPKVRLPGSGGAVDLAATSRRLIILSSATTPDHYPEHVSYISTPGYLTGGDSRRKAGFKDGTGPTVFVNPLGRFCFDGETGEIYLQDLHRGVSIDEARGCVSWPLRMAEHLEEIEPPSREEIDTLREELAKAKERLYKIPT